MDWYYMYINVFSNFDMQLNVRKWKKLKTMQFLKIKPAFFVQHLWDFLPLKKVQFPQVYSPISG